MGPSSQIRSYIILAAAVATIVGTAIAYIGSVHARCADLRSSAVGAFIHRDWQPVTRKCEEYLHCDSDDQQLFRICIESNFQAKNFPQARDWINRTRLAFPDDPVPDYWKAVMLIIEQKDFAGALPLLTAVHFMVEDHYPKVNLYLAMALIKTGKIDSGCDNLRYYLDSPYEDKSPVRQEAAILYTSRCVADTH